MLVKLFSPVLLQVLEPLACSVAGGDLQAIFRPIRVVNGRGLVLLGIDQCLWVFGSVTCRLGKGLKTGSGSVIASSL